MSIYYKENTQYFERAMRSIWNEQTIRPNEIVLVEDGPLTIELYQSIVSWKEELGDFFKTIQIKKNIGLGGALNVGLKYCSYELVARMDADDIAAPVRFENQLKIFEDDSVDVCGSWAGEFSENENLVIAYRKLPERHKDIVLFAKMRSPINHPTVMYKKSAVQNAGGYKNMMWFEDYYLWGRMILSGSEFYNIQESIVSMRAGYGQLERRSGFKYAIAEFKLRKEFFNIGFISIYNFIFYTPIRFIIRILPKVLFLQAYKLLRHGR